VASSGGGQPSLNRLTGQFPNASAAAPAPAADNNPYNTLPAGTQLSSLSTMVVELLLTGQQLFPFSAADQYDVASSVNGLLTYYPHLQELSNIGVRIYVMRSCCMGCQFDRKEKFQRSRQCDALAVTCNQAHLGALE